MRETGVILCGWGTATDIPEKVEHWTAKRRAGLVLSIVRGEISAEETARKHGLTVAEIEEWTKRFLKRPGNEEALREQQIKQLKQKIGELVLELDVMKEAIKQRPVEEKRSDEPGEGR